MTKIRLFLVLFITTFGLWSQTPTGEVAGNVLDSSGAAIPAAQVTILNRNTGLERATRSNESGFYTFPALPVGPYTITAKHDGFRRTDMQNVTVTALASLRVDVTLQVGEVTDVVSVTDEAPLVETRGSIQGVLVDDRRVRDLPLNGRNAVDLVMLAPGVNRSSTRIESNFDQQRLSVNGGRQTGVNFLLDGGGLNYFHRGAGLLLPPPDALQEFRLATTGTPAEYGRGSVTMSAVTRSGTNELHGSAWEFLRNDALDARSFFASDVSKLRFNQFGATVGGPIFIPKFYDGRNKNFFFFSYQGLRIRRDAVNSSSIPLSAAERQGDFSGAGRPVNDPLTGLPFAGGIIPQSRFDPVANQVLNNWIPSPNRPNGSYVSQVSVPSDGDQFLGKWDSVITDNNRLNVRYFHDDSAGGEPFPNSSTLPGYSPVTNGQGLKALTVEDFHTFTPTLFLSTRGNHTRFDYNEANSTRQTLAELGATNFVHAGGPATLPGLIVPGRFTLAPGRDRRRLSEALEFSQSLSYVRGAHQWKFGYEIQRHRFMYRDNSNAGGQFRFDGSQSGVASADFLLGQAFQLIQSSPLDTDQRYTPLGFYAQDTWRVHSRISLNYGIRFEAYPVWKERFGQTTSFVPGLQSTRFPNAAPGLVFDGDEGFPYGNDNRNIAPRIGVAWDVFGTGRTAIRSSWGVFYEPLTAEMTGGVQSPQPFALTVQVNNRQLSAPFAGGPVPFPFAVDTANAVFNTPVLVPKSFNPDLRIPSTMNYNFGVQQQLGRQWMLDVSYVGNTGRNLANIRQANPAVYGPGATTGNTNARRIYAPAIGSVGQLNTDANSSYNSLQVALLRRFANGLTLNTNYTWAKAIDEVTSGSSAFAQVSQQGSQNPFDRKADRGLHDENIAHRVAASYLYSIPFSPANGFLRSVLGGWELGGLLTLETGKPFTVTTGTDNSRTGVGFDRPNVLHNPELSGDRSRGERIANYFDTTAFVANPIGSFGNTGRNSLIGPGSFVWNSSLSKSFRFQESQRLQFRWEAFNLTNTPTFLNPNAVLSSPAFGRIQGAGPGRVQQVSLKYEF